MQHTLPSPRARQSYIIFLGLLSLGLLTWSIFGYEEWQPYLTFILLILLSIGSQLLSVSLFGNSPMAANVSTTFNLSAIALFGVSAGILLGFLSEAFYSIYHIIRNERSSPKVILERVVINAGMAVIYTAIAGFAFVWLSDIITIPVLNILIPWIVATTLSNQANFWLLTIIIYLTYGIPPASTYQDQKASILIDLVITGVGGGLLAQAVITFGNLGIFALLLPILSSTYAYSYIVRKSQEQMENLEELVDLRTAALQKAIDDLETLQREKDHFVAVLTHDMRTPLTSIQGYANLLIMKELERDRQVHMANVILRNSNTLLDIVNNLLDVERLKAGKEIELEYSSFDFSLVVSQVLEEVASRAQDKQIAIHYQPPTSPILLWADKRQIKRVLQNLVSNGVKYTPEKGEVTVTTQSMTGQVLVRVEDNGYGIPDDELPTIFDSYSRVKDHQHVAVGTGLGLAIVKNLVEAHKGIITVDSQLDEGTTFTVIVPNEPTV